MTCNRLHCTLNLLSRGLCAERRLHELGVELTPPPTPFGAYVEAVQTGNLLFLSGMLAYRARAEVRRPSRKELDANAGREAVRIAALNVYQRQGERRLTQ